MIPKRFSFGHREHLMICLSCGQENRDGARFCDKCATSMTPFQEELCFILHRDGYTPSEGFIGRQKELTELKSALEDTLSGQGRLVMLVGEPGIGKTRIAQELAAYAETLGTKYCGGAATKKKERLPIGPGCSPFVPTFSNRLRNNSSWRWVPVLLTSPKSSPTFATN